MQVAVILVNWNQAKITIRCIESLLKSTQRASDFSFNIIVVDNNSEEKSIRLLESYLSKNANLAVDLIQSPENIGFAGGNNLGIKHALKHTAIEYIWLLNNDIITQKNALNNLVKAAQRHPVIKVWGSTIYEVFPQIHFHCAGGFSYNALLSIPKPITFSKETTRPSGLYYPLSEMDYPAGASMFVKAASFRESGLLNEIYFLYYEELDFVHQIGGKQHIAWCPDSVLHHQSGHSTGSKNPNKGKGSWIAHYYGNLSALKYTWLYYKLYFPVVFFFRLMTKALLFIKNGDYDGFRPLFGAYRDFFKWMRGRLGEREKRRLGERETWRKDDLEKG